MKEAEVLGVDADGRAEQVRFVLDAGAIKDDYTLALHLGRTTTAVSWTLARGPDAHAPWTAPTPWPTTADGTTEVTYQLAVDVKIPMLGMIKRKAEKVIIDTALKELKKRVES